MRFHFDLGSFSCQASCAKTVTTDVLPQERAMVGPLFNTHHAVDATDHHRTEREQNPDNLKREYRP